MDEPPYGQLIFFFSDWLYNKLKSSNAGNAGLGINVNGNGFGNGFGVSANIGNVNTAADPGFTYDNYDGATWVESPSTFAKTSSDTVYWKRADSKRK